MLDQAVKNHFQLESRTRHLVLPARLGYGDDTFDGVFSIATLMHLQVPEINQCLAEIHRLLKPGGHFLFSVSTKGDMDVPKITGHLPVSVHGRIDIWQETSQRKASDKECYVKFAKLVNTGLVPHQTRFIFICPQFYFHLAAGRSFNQRSSPRRRSTWYREYINTLVQRDVRDVANIRSSDVMPRLLAAAASQTAQLFNVAELASPFQLSRPTVRDYVTILERIFLLEQLQPWHSNRLSRLVKTPKLHVTDTGLACVLLNVNAKSLWADRKVLGQVLETFVFQELRRQASWSDEEIQFYFFRDRYKNEVDLVLERENRIAAIEVKSAASVQKKDFAGIEKLQEAAADRFRVGVVLYDGELCTRFGDGLFAVPIRRLWESR